MDSTHAANLFNTYRQEENNFTNGLFSLLRISAYERPRFIASFVNDLLHISPQGGIDSVFCVRVLRGIEFADAELRCRNCSLRFETKIVSGALTHTEIRRRLKELKGCSGRFKRVILLTPDDPKSQYVKRFLATHKPNVLHLGWKNVYDYLEKAVSNGKPAVFSELVNQFLEQIHECVFKHDFAGVITKIAFGDESEVYADTYLEAMKGWDGTWWDTPRLYKELDGTGRKLLLYDRDRQGITAEVEIKKVARIPRRRKWCWRNQFVPGTLRVFRKPIPLSHIRSIPGFEGFSMYRKDRSAYRNITRDQYRQLMEKRSDRQ